MLFLPIGISNTKDQVSISHANGALLAHRYIFTESDSSINGKFICSDDAMASFTFIGSWHIAAAEFCLDVELCIKRIFVFMLPLHDDSNTIDNTSNDSSRVGTLLWLDTTYSCFHVVGTLCSNIVLPKTLSATVLLGCGPCVCWLTNTHDNDDVNDVITLWRPNEGPPCVRCLNDIFVQQPPSIWRLLAMDDEGGSWLIQETVHGVCTFHGMTISEGKIVYDYSTLQLPSSLASIVICITAADSAPCWCPACNGQRIALVCCQGFGGCGSYVVEVDMVAGHRVRIMELPADVVPVKASLLHVDREGGYTVVLCCPLKRSSDNISSTVIWGKRKGGIIIETRRLNVNNDCSILSGIGGRSDLAWLVHRFISQKTLPSVLDPLHTWCDEIFQQSFRNNHPALVALEAETVQWRIKNRKEATLVQQKKAMLQRGLQELQRSSQLAGALPSSKVNDLFPFVSGQKKVSPRIDNAPNASNNVLSEVWILRSVERFVDAAGALYITLNLTNSDSATFFGVSVFAIQHSTIVDKSALDYSDVIAKAAPMSAITARTVLQSPMVSGSETKLWLLLRWKTREHNGCESSIPGIVVVGDINIDPLWYMKANAAAVSGISMTNSAATALATTRPLCGVRCLELSSTLTDLTVRLPLLFQTELHMHRIMFDIPTKEAACRVIYEETSMWQCPVGQGLLSNLACVLQFSNDVTYIQLHFIFVDTSQLFLALRALIAALSNDITIRLIDDKSPFLAVTTVANALQSELADCSDLEETHHVKGSKLEQDLKLNTKQLKQRQQTDIAIANLLYVMRRNIK